MPDYLESPHHYGPPPGRNHQVHPDCDACLFSVLDNPFGKLGEDNPPYLPEVPLRSYGRPPIEPSVTEEAKDDGSEDRLEPISFPWVDDAVDRRQAAGSAKEPFENRGKQRPSAFAINHSSPQMGLTVPKAGRPSESN